LTDTGPKLSTVSQKVSELENKFSPSREKYMDTADSGIEMELHDYENNGYPHKTATDYNQQTAGEAWEPFNSGVEEVTDCCCSGFPCYCTCTGFPCFSRRKKCEDLTKGKRGLGEIPFLEEMTLQSNIDIEPSVYIPPVEEPSVYIPPVSTDIDIESSVFFSTQDESIPKLEDLNCKLEEGNSVNDTQQGIEVISFEDEDVDNCSKIVVDEDVDNCSKIIVDEHVDNCVKSPKMDTETNHVEANPSATSPIPRTDTSQSRLINVMPIEDLEM